MTTYRAIGKYETGATDAEKIAALKQCLCDAAIELIDLGQRLGQVEDALEDALCAAEEERDTVKS